jgi:hypothetical protein
MSIPASQGSRNHHQTYFESNFIEELDRVYMGTHCPDIRAEKQTSDSIEVQSYEQWVHRVDLPPPFRNSIEMNEREVLESRQTI